MRRNMHYSYNSAIASDFGDNNKITAYVKGDLKYGTEPVVINYVTGDVNGSGSVDAIYYSILKKYLLGATNLDSEAYNRADVNGDNTVDIIDLALI